MARIFGHVAGAEPGKVFASRAELAAADVHRPRQAGISGSVPDGADSIVVSGGYEDDENRGPFAEAHLMLAVGAVLCRLFIHHACFPCG